MTLAKEHEATAKMHEEQAAKGAKTTEAALAAKGK
jgi:hypothetical protein